MAKVLTVPETERLNITFDEEADVLYISFWRSSEVSDSKLPDNDIILHYFNDELIGFTVLSFKKRLKQL